MNAAFRLEERADRIAVLTFDRPGHKVNTLGAAVLTELGAIVTALTARPDLHGLLLTSGKPGQAIAGADLNEIAAVGAAGPEAIGRAIDLGRAVFEGLSRLPFPTVALIDGACLGGGTELVLACDDRIVSDAPGTQLGLPEVQLGLLPAWGGTQRLPRLVGVSAAVELITGGEPVRARRAVELGLAFDAVPVDRLLDEGVRRVEALQVDGSWRGLREARRGPIALGRTAAAFLFGVAEGVVAARTKGPYPAPRLALATIRDGIHGTLDEGLAVERAAALELFGSPIAAHLIGLFFERQRLGRDPGVEDPAVTPRPVGRVGVLGAGLMGAGIAAAHARSGLPTAMVDVDDARLAAGLNRAEEVVTRRIAIGRATPRDLTQLLGLLSTSTTPQIFADCDVVIEAVTEDEALKAQSYRRLAGVIRPGTILASNTSSIPITRLAAAAPEPERFVGMHFFQPVDRMELVEVIRGEQTGDEAVATVVALARRLRKTPIVVRDGPGFLVNRVLFFYLNEALILLGAGVSMDDLDRAATAFGMPMGPVALQDLIGLDTMLFAGRILIDAWPDRALVVPLLAELVAAGRLGRKSGAGFRRFPGGGSKSEPDPAFEPFRARHLQTAATAPTDPQALQDRLFLPLLLETIRVLEAGLVRGPADADVGLILGIGFPPFRGGPLRWADTLGAAEVLRRLEPLRPLGPRFEPPALLVELARTGGTFHPRPQAVAPVG